MKSMKRSYPIAFVEILVGGSHYDAKVDVFSFGVSLFEVLTCSKPYTDTEEKRRQITNQHVFTIAVDKGMRPGPIPTKPDDVTKLAVNCWAPDPKSRPTMQQVAQMIETMKNDRYLNPFITDNLT